MPNQPMLGRILVEVELHESVSKRETGGSKPFVVGLLLSCYVGVDLLPVGMIEGQRGMDLSE